MIQSNGILGENKKIKGAKEVVFEDIKFKSRLEMTCYKKFKEAGLDFQDMITIDTELLSSAFGMKISEEDISNMTKGYMGEISSAITTDTSKAQTAFTDTLVALATDMLNEYITNNQTAGVAVIKLSDVETIVDNFMEKEETKTKLAGLEAEYIITQTEFSKIYSETIKGFLTEYSQFEIHYDDITTEMLKKAKFKQDGSIAERN